jgi:hypothetical protein
MSEMELAVAREERLAKNEVLFRAVNEKIEQQAIRFGGLDGYEFICECSSRACMDRVALTLSQYEHIREHAKRFFVAPGHSDITVEVIVETTAGYEVVEKDGSAGIVAEFDDPRIGEIGH